MNNSIVIIYKEVGKDPVFRKVENSIKSFETILGGEIETIPYEDIVIICRKNRDSLRANIYINNIGFSIKGNIILVKRVDNKFVSLNREQAITREATLVKKIDVSQKIDYVLPEKVLSKEMSAKKAFQKGEIIDKRFVKMKPDVARNGEVRIFFVSNGAVMITIDGTAMADGMTGDYINVENKNYKKVYTGKVIGENRVLVNI